jgi:omega-amidase
MKIALCSLDQIWENKGKNKGKCESAIIKAVSHKSDIIVFPEMTLTGFSMNTSTISEKFSRSDSIRWFKEQARSYKIYIVFGMVLGGVTKPRNSLIVINDRGRMIGRYDKIHTFSYAGEDKYYEKGEKIVSCRISGEKMGLSICYDLRFPELYTILAQSCYGIINIANWPEERIEHWKSLLLARAIENQLFIIGVNRQGTDGKGLRYPKSSLIISPLGEMINPQDKYHNIDIFSIDFNDVKSNRYYFPALKDRRTKLYYQYV